MRGVRCSASERSTEGTRFAGRVRWDRAGSARPVPHSQAMALPALALADPVASGIINGTSTVEQFYAIELDGLVVDTILDFNLYLPAGPGRFLFFRSTSLPFTVFHRNRLLENNVRTVYVRASERARYLQYLEHHLDQVMANPEVSTPSKAKLLYTVSKAVVEEAFEQPRSQTIVPRTRQLAVQTVDFVLRSERALGQLARLMTTDYYTYTHSINVCVFGVALARHAGVSRDDIREFAVGALLHDLGKTQVPKELLTKRGPLTPDEMQAMREHVANGERLLAQHGGLSALAIVPVAQHHEKLDGSGYPRGLAGSDVHLFGRIAAIADVFDAMTSDRTYQRAFTAYGALKKMKEELAPHFDRMLLERFIRTLRQPAVR
jgi:HD-GYP domain-containing protein (c-di-GMP phosphodiesterase class II)